MVLRPYLRRLAGLLLVTTLAIPGAVARVSALSGHQECKAQDHGCGHVAVMSCCCHDGQPDQSAPAQPASGRIQVNGPTDATGPVATLEIPVRAVELSSAALRAHSPPHGHHSTDLSILFSTFLI